MRVLDNAAAPLGLQRNMCPTRYCCSPLELQHDLCSLSALRYSCYEKTVQNPAADGVPFADFGFDLICHPST